MLRVDDCVVLRRVSMGGGEENPEPPTEVGSRRTSNGPYNIIMLYSPAIILLLLFKRNLWFTTKPISSGIILLYT